MKKMKLMFRNVQTLVQQHFLVLCLFIIGIIVSSITILYSIGKVYSMAEYVSDEQRVTVAFDQNVCFSECNHAIDSLSDELSEISNIKVTVGDENTFAMKMPWNYMIQYGTSFDSTDEPQIVVGCFGTLYGEIGSYAEVDGKSYRIVGQRAVEYFNQINYASLTDDTAIQKIEIILSPISSSQKIDRIGKKVESAFPNAQITLPNTMDYASFLLSDPQFYIAIILTVFAVLNLMQLYRYLLNKRKNLYAVYQICGCNKFTGFLIFFGEMELLSLVPYGITVLCYKLFLESLFYDGYYYSIFLSCRQISIITAIFAVLQLLLFSPLILRYSKATPKQLKYTYEVD